VSTTIGLGYSAPSNADPFNDIKVIAERFGYGLLNGIDYAESDVRGGLENTKEIEGWDHLLLLQAPINEGVSLAFGIHEELSAFETQGKRPKFFDFLIELSELCSGRCRKLSIFFSGEWYKADRVRFSYGSVDDLISLLSMPGHWGIRYLIPQTGKLQDSDETPLLFDLKF
tara:strand:+ start:688 stop:1200 length:513 start_codon:yes stop_codon:yes gene_type:complete